MNKLVLFFFLNYTVRMLVLFYTWFFQINGFKLLCKLFNLNCIGLFWSWFLNTRIFFSEFAIGSSWIYLFHYKYKYIYIEIIEKTKLLHFFFAIISLKIFNYLLIIYLYKISQLYSPQLIFQTSTISYLSSISLIFLYIHLFCSFSPPRN